MPRAKGRKRIELTISSEVYDQIQKDAATAGVSATEWLLTGRGYSAQPRYKFPDGGLNPRGRKLQHHSSLQFQRKIASGVEILREASNGRTGDRNVSAVEFSDGSIGVFTNGDPEWVGSWAEALQLLKLEEL